MPKETDHISPVHKITDADYERAELNQLKAALNRSYTERFKMMATLMKMNIMFKKAKIIRQPLFDLKEKK